MSGLIAYGTYIPASRLKRSAIGDALGERGGKGTRAVASYDEDTTSMGVEAARAALRGVSEGARPSSLYFATASPAYLDKTNATAIHAAAGLDEDCLAVDMAGSVRSGVGALWAAIDAPEPALAVLSDVRTGRPGSAEERDGGDAAAAFLFGEAGGQAPLASVIGRASVSAEFLDRWRLPSEPVSRVWEERFGEHVYAPLAARALDAALKDAGVTADALDHLVVAGMHGRAVKRAAAKAGTRPEAVADDLTGSIGNTGTAHAGVLLADALDRAQPGHTIAVLVLADGASALVLRAEPGLASRTGETVATQVAAGRDDLSYATFLTWRGFIQREPPRRPDPQAPAGPPSFRSELWKFAFTAGRCDACGMRHLPPSRVCVQCGAVDKMSDERLADVPATIATYTVDRLAFTPSPPLVAVVIDFDGGGRYRCEMTDVDPGMVSIGDRVQMSFRRLVTAGGVHNYFWKARPLREA